MPIDVMMSQLSPTMTEGRIARWLKQEGDTLTSGELLVEVETDKATMEVEVVDEGVLHKILAAEGATVAVGTPIAVIAEDGEEIAADYQPQAMVAASVEQVAEQRVDPPVAAAVVAVAPQVEPTAVDNSRIKASPLARRLAKQKGINLAAISGSGPHGRIVKADITRAVKRGIRLGMTASTTPPPVRPLPQGPLPYHADEYEAVENSMMRKAIARRLLESKQQVPHFYVTLDVTMDRLLDLRAQLNEAANGEFKLSVNDFIIKAASNALIKVPEANASWTDQATLMHKHAHISVAVAIEGGLITPVVRFSEQKSIVEISTEVKDLAGRARQGALKPEEYSGGTFSISNLGMFGVKQFAAIVNPPEGAILAVGGSMPRAVVEDGALVVRNVMTLTLSCDHRVVDGAVGASFLAALKQELELPAGLLL
ncbi:MAG: pyruvate dehydrogenase complex dihydrolipoamide acetyltransferase [Mariprofundales bacterium]|nr:pyruvate dehydrogenase complex dihydrolipoamide acetyltransferase [Mariprofundales bacterium]